jgi:hypothetical protein
VLIKRWWANEKMNVTGGMFKDKKKWGNRWKQFAFIVKSCVHFQSFGVHSNMNAESVITTTNIKGKGSIEEWTYTKVEGGSGIVENN